MPPSTNSRLTVAATVARWIARVLSALILLFWGFFIVAHAFGDEGGASRPLNTNDYILFAMMAVWLVGLSVAWRWELTGGMMTLAGLLIAAVVNWRVLTFPGILIAVTAVLFLSSWWIRRTRSDQPLKSQVVSE